VSVRERDEALELVMERSVDTGDAREHGQFPLLAPD